MKSKKTSGFIRTPNLARGFTLIFAILISSLLVALGISISGFVIKQLAISAVSRESQIAFYAADNGVECALYWDVQGPYLSSPFYFASTDSGHSSITGSMSCGLSVEWPTPSVTIGSDYYQNNFIVHYGTVSPCAVVSLKKYADRNVIDSYGINDCSNTNNKYRVERAIRVEYK